MSPRKRPLWVRRDGDWDFKPNKIVFLDLNLNNQTIEVDRSGHLTKVGKTQIVVPEWWERGITIKNGPEIKFRVQVKNYVPGFTSINLIGTEEYPIIKKEDFEEVSLNLTRLLLWSVREIAQQTKVLPDGQIDLMSDGINEEQWEILGREVNRIASRRNITPKLLEQVAKVYLEAKNNKQSTTRAIADTFHYSESWARNLVAIARKDGFLDPVKKASKKGGK